MGLYRFGWTVLVRVNFGEMYLPRLTCVTILGGPKTICAICASNFTSSSKFYLTKN